MGSKLGFMRSKVGSPHWRTRLNLEFKELRALQLQIRPLQEQALDTENHLGWNNIRILGLPTEFAEKLLTTILDTDKVPPSLVVERVHRVPLKPPKLGVPPSTFLLRLLNSCDRNRILEAAKVILVITF